MEKVRVGIIGLGNIGVDAHLAAYNKIKNEYPTSPVANEANNKINAAK